MRRLGVIIVGLVVLPACAISGPGDADVATIG
jgi:hypothetical protein